MWRKLASTVRLLALTAALAAAEKKPATAPIRDADLKKWVEDRVHEWQPTAEEKRFDEIGWCHSIGEAERLARQHKRPIFLFTHDGRMSAGRC